MEKQLEEFLGLKQYVQDTYDNLKTIFENKSLAEDEKSHLIMESYANMKDLEDESKHIRLSIRSTFKIKDLDYKKWRKEQDDQEQKE